MIFGGKFDTISDILVHSKYFYGGLMTVIKIAIRRTAVSLYHCRLRHSGYDRVSVIDINRLARVAQNDFPQLEETDIEVEIIDNPHGPSYIGIGFDVEVDIDIPPEYMKITN